MGCEVPLFGQVPLGTRLREAGDAGSPLVPAEPEAPAATVLRDVAQKLTVRSRGLSGRVLPVSPAGR